MENYLLGLDNGTMVKAVIFDGNGKEVAGAAAKLRMITPESSMTERDMEELWEANCQVIREALAKAGDGAAEKIRASCSHGKGLYLWGKDNKAGLQRHSIHRRPGLGNILSNGRKRRHCGKGL